jgi:hypothetical protein
MQNMERRGEGDIRGTEKSNPYEEEISNDEKPRSLEVALQLNISHKSTLNYQT